MDEPFSLQTSAAGGGGGDGLKCQILESMSLFMSEPLFTLNVRQRKQRSGCQVPDSCRSSSSLPTAVCQQQLSAKISDCIIYLFIYFVFRTISGKTKTNENRLELKKVATSDVRIVLVPPPTRPPRPNHHHHPNRILS